MAAQSASNPERRPKGHRRRDHVPRHVREEHRIARTAAAGAAGAVVIGAAFGLTGGALGGDDGTVVSAPAGNLDTLLAERGEHAGTVSRGLERAPLAAGQAGNIVPRAQGAAVQQVDTQQADSGGGSSTALPDIPADCEEYSGNRAIGCALLEEFGFGLDQMPALDALWTRESGWNHEAYNPSSGAYGIPQALPGNKMASVADDWETNPATQIRWGLGYIKDRYGTVDAAWAHSEANGWY